MTARNSRLLDEIVVELRSQIGPVSMDLGALKSTRNNSLVNEKIANSFSGHFLDASIRAITVKLILFVTRTCEKNGNSVSKALELLPLEAESIELKRRLDHPEWPDDFLEIGSVQESISKLDRKFHEIISSSAYKRARLARDERYAHLLRGKSDIRKKQEREFEEFEDITFNEVESLSESVLEIVEEVIRIWTFSIESVES